MNEDSLDEENDIDKDMNESYNKNEETCTECKIPNLYERFLIDNRFLKYKDLINKKSMKRSCIEYDDMIERFI